jgi:predicted amidohydrolase
MREPLSVAVAQPSCVPYDVGANVATHAAAVRAAGARVVVFPELSLTGYELDAPPVAVEDPRLAPLVEACAEVGAVALVGAPVSDGQRRESDGQRSESDGQRREHIATLAVDGAGVSVAYRKTWVDTTETRFASGEPAVLVVDGWRLGLAICKDTGIAQHAADTAALGIDAYVAGTLMFDHEVGVQDERARRIAVTHGVRVAFASFAAPTGGGYSQPAGHSGIWGADGVVLARSGAEPDAVARATFRER